MTYLSISHRRLAAILYICFPTGIWKCIKGERKSASGYAWRKAEGDDNATANLAITNISGLAALKSVIKVAAKTEFDRPIEQRDQFGRLIKTHKTVKSITPFVPTQKVITKVCEDGGGEVCLDEGKTFRFRYKKQPMGNALAGAGVLGIPLPIAAGSAAAVSALITKKRNRSVYDAQHNLPDGTAVMRVAGPPSSSSSSALAGASTNASASASASSISTSSSSSSSSSNSSSSSGSNNQAAVEVVFKQPTQFAGTTIR